MKPKLSLIFLQGLGNSIINFPIYHQLSRKFDVDVMAYNNGSSSFYREFGANVIQMNSVKDIFLKSFNQSSNVAVCTYPNWRREMTALNLVSASEKVHVHCKKMLEPFFLGHTLPSRKNRHDVENNWSILTHFGLSQNFSLDFADELNLKKPKLETYAVIHPTASTVFKYYPKGFWLELIRFLESKFDSIYIISTKSAEEMAFSQSILTPKCKHLPGLGFKELSILVANCDQFIGLDSSMMHLAALFKRNILALWSFADFKRIYPYTSEAHLYVPQEVQNAQNFVYPKGELKWISRARAESVIRILNNDLKSDFGMSDESNNNIQIYFY